ncbi:MAG: BolA/IbaG family iron-sulfur metabolism protein [Cellvibrionales bacterium]|nr:BolA/IbaG family iron-sulfur metabolism protein [Cellvibrionales bacterium]
MQAEELKSLLQESFDDATVDVQFDGSHVLIDIVSQAFQGKRTLQRQQLIYKIMGEKVSDGTFHAVHMQLHTPEERTASEG